MRRWLLDRHTVVVVAAVVVVGGGGGGGGVGVVVARPSRCHCFFLDPAAAPDPDPGLGPRSFQTREMKRTTMTTMMIMPSQPPSLRLPLLSPLW